MRKAKYLAKKLIEWLRSMEDAEEQERPEDPPVKTYIYGGNIEGGKWLQ